MSGRVPAFLVVPLGVGVLVVALAATYVAAQTRAADPAAHDDRGQEDARPGRAKQPKRWPARTRRRSDKCPPSGTAAAAVPARPASSPPSRSARPRRGPSRRRPRGRAGRCPLSPSGTCVRRETGRRPPTRRRRSPSAKQKAAAKSGRNRADSPRSRRARPPSCSASRPTGFQRAAQHVCAAAQAAGRGRPVRAARHQGRAPSWCGPRSRPASAMTPIRSASRAGPVGLREGRARALRALQLAAPRSGADMRGSQIWYKETPDQNRPDFDGRFAGRIDVTDLTRGLMSRRATASPPTIPGSPNLQAGLAELPIFTTIGGSVGVAHRFNRFEIAAQGLRRSHRVRGLEADRRHDGQQRGARLQSVRRAAARQLRAHARVSSRSRRSTSIRAATTCRSTPAA